MVRIYYSPEVIDWMCKYRKGPDQILNASELPEGAMIIKEMVRPKNPIWTLARLPGTNKLWVAPPPGGTAATYDEKFDEWTVMLKTPLASTDGWYWADYSREGQGNPGIYDRAAFGQFPFPGSDGQPVTQPLDSTFFPTYGKYSLNDVQFPNYGVGNYCVYCHASAAGQSTFSSFTNLFGTEIRYDWLPATRTSLDV